MAPSIIFYLQLSPSRASEGPSAPHDARTYCRVSLQQARKPPEAHPVALASQLRAAVAPVELAQKMDQEPQHCFALRAPIRCWPKEKYVCALLIRPNPLCATSTHVGGYHFLRRRACMCCQPGEN